MRFIPLKKPASEMRIRDRPISNYLVDYRNQWFWNDIPSCFQVFDNFKNVIKRNFIIIFQSRDPFRSIALLKSEIGWDLTKLVRAALFFRKKCNFRISEANFFKSGWSLHRGPKIFVFFSFSVHSKSACSEVLVSKTGMHISLVVCCLLESEVPFQEANCPAGPN